MAQSTLDVAVRSLGQAESQDLLQENRRVRQLLTEGCPVEDFDSSGKPQGNRIRYIDFDQAIHNGFVVVNQFVLKRNSRARRLDLVAFVNGIPMAVFELKSPSRRCATLQSAWRQLRTYQREFPGLFAPCAVQVISDGLSSAVGRVGAELRHFVPRRLADPADERYMLTDLIHDLFAQPRCLDLVRNLGSIVPENGRYPDR